MESSPDNVRDGSARSDGPGPASSEEKAYERNRYLTPRKCPTRLKPDGYGPGLQRVAAAAQPGVVNSEAGF
jgi:hypothetical protein